MAPHGREAHITPTTTAQRSIINTNSVTNFNLSNGPSYQQINGALDPRTLQIGLRVEF